MSARPTGATARTWKRRLFATNVRGDTPPENVSYPADNVSSELQLRRSTDEKISPKNAVSVPTGSIDMLSRAVTRLPRVVTSELLALLARPGTVGEVEVPPRSPASCTMPDVEVVAEGSADQLWSPRRKVVAVAVPPATFAVGMRELLPSGA